MPSKRRASKAVYDRMVAILEQRHPDVTGADRTAIRRIARAVTDAAFGDERGLAYLGLMERERMWVRELLPAAKEFERGSG